MGLFTKSSRGQANRRQIRTMQTEHPDHSDLRYKAKSKLIGAVVLAILGIIFLPLIFKNDEPVTVTSLGQPPLVAPQANTTERGVEGAISITTAGVNAPTTTETGSSTTQVATLPETPATIPQSVANAVGDLPSSSATQTTPPTTAHSNTAAGQTPQTTKTDPKPTPKVNNTITENKRTDDGSVARAILEGKTPPKASSTNQTFPKPVTTSQRYAVQVGAFSSMDDARQQRDRLSASGVSNVFIQNAVVNGRQTYRLRVGPFTSQESAQAALTRLRGLGHAGFITGN